MVQLERIRWAGEKKGPGLCSVWLIEAKKDTVFVTMSVKI